jgi:molybdopterin/thiamine biosynthesis adenylyltransferase
VLRIRDRKAAIERLNPNVKVTALPARLTADNARAMVGAFDVVADGSDNFATRYAVSDACYYAKRPLVTAAAGAFDGALTVLRPYENGPFGEPNPTFRCLSSGAAARGDGGEGSEQADVPFAMGFMLGDLSEGGKAAEPNALDPLHGHIDRKS